jgi:hypothetical protein
VTLEAPIQLCFDLARRVDFHLYSATGSREQVPAGTTSGLLSWGEVQWGGWHIGLWPLMRVRITAFHPPTHFQDAMIRGPFRYFRHDHLFEQRGPTTAMLDGVKFNSFPGHHMADWLIVGPHLRKFLAVRNQRLKTAAESDGWRRFLPQGSGYN